MKHYEMILEYKCRIVKKKELRETDRKYELINYDDKMDRNEKIEYRTCKLNNCREISYGKKQDAIKNANMYLQKINTENNAICLTNIDDKYMTFIGVTKSDNKDDIEVLLKKTYEYLQTNISSYLLQGTYWDDEDEIKIIELSDKFIYKEISAKEFLIDNVNELISDTDNEAVIKDYFEKLNEHNYNVKELGFRSESLNYNLIGLTNAKRIIEKIIASAKIDITRKRLCDNRENDKLIKSPMHLAFLGNPGTAKTTVARLFARIFKEENIIKNPNIIEVGRKDLIGQYVGQTAPLVKKAFEKAKGGILFIDEAYALLDEYKGGYGEEAINTIIQEMENRRNEVIVIFAGYTERMKEFIDNNEGMKSRINYIIEFDDYTSDELAKIFALICKNEKLLYKPSVIKYVKAKFAEITERTDFTTLGNGRFVRKIIEATKLNMDYRLSLLGEEKLDKISINTLTKTDVEKAIEDILENIGKAEMQKLGFAA